MASVYTTPSTAWEFCLFSILASTTCYQCFPFQPFWWRYDWSSFWFLFTDVDCLDIVFVKCQFQSFAHISVTVLTSPVFSIFLTPCKTVSYFHWKKPKCPKAGKWINMPWYIHTVKYYPTIKINDIQISTMSVKLKNMALCKRNWIEKNTYCVILLVWHCRRGKTNLWWYKTAHWVPGAGRQYWL